MRQDLHTHTTFCDGANTPEEMVQAALAQGLDCLGFSGHSHTPLDESYCMSPKGTQDYRREISRLKGLYRDRLTILCGIEQDLSADLPAVDYDYVIGSAHYLHPQGNWFPVDESREILVQAADRFYCGDIYALAEDYFRTVAQVDQVTHCDIVGHFDLIRKFNGDGALFDEHHPRYTAARDRAIQALCSRGALFEINTGAISRGYLDLPYPHPELWPAIAAQGGRFVLSSDSHRSDTLCFQFHRWTQELQRMGLAACLTTFLPK